MTTYAVLRHSDGAEVYRYNASAPIEWQGFEFAAFDHVAQPDPPPPVALPPPTPQQWELTEFLRRFTSAERMAAKSRRTADAVLDDLWTLLESSPLIHSDDVDLRRGLGYLVNIGVLTADRRLAILGDAA